MFAALSASSTRREQRGVDLDRRLRRRDLHGRHFGEEVRQRVDDADHQRDGDDDVLPERVAVHGRARLRGGGVGAAARRADGARPCSGARAAGARRHSALIVPLGSSCAIAARWTVISTFGAISTRRVLVGQLGDLADDAAGGDDFVALLQRLEHRLRLLGALLLRADQQEVEDDEDRDHRQERHQVAAAGQAPAAWA